MLYLCLVCELWVEQLQLLVDHCEVSQWISAAAVDHVHQRSAALRVGAQNRTAQRNITE